MKRGFAGSLIVLLTLISGTAATAAPPTLGTPAVQTGNFTIDGMPVDVSIWAQVCKRGAESPNGFPNKGPDGNHPESPTAKTHLICWVPTDYKPDETWGLLVMPSWSDGPGIPGGYPEICEKHRLLMVTAQGGGNSHYREWRVAQALVARQEMVKRYKVNAARIYLTGGSGGGRISSLAAYLFPDLFTGAVCNCGVDTPKIGGRLPPGAGDVVQVVPDAIQLAHDHSRFYLFTGSGDDNHQDTQIAYNWLKLNNFKYITFFSQDGAGHGNMSNENFEKGLVALDTPLEPDAAIKLKQASSYTKQGLSGSAMMSYQQAIAMAPCTVSANEAQTKLTELQDTYQQDLAQVQTVIAAGDHIKSNAAIAKFAHTYLPYARDDVAALRKAVLGPGK